MKVLESQISLFGQRKATSNRQTITRNTQSAIAEREAPSLSQSREKLLEAVSVRLSAKGLKGRIENLEPGSKSYTVDDAKVQLIILMLKSLTGKNLDFESIKNILKGDIASVSTNNGSGSAVQQTQTLEQIEIREETEDTVFYADAIIKTEDGQEVHFQIELGMSRSFRQELRIESESRQLTDPLVLNFAGTAADLGETSFDFDLNSDGQTEQISSLKAGSGFLALDKNQDGVINNGSELFGPSNGNGFAELSVYDLDDNDFIDENDPIFDELKVFTQDSEGNQYLSSLYEKGVGAISLGSIETPFELRDGQNSLRAKIRSTGVFVGASGNHGTVQQVDFAI
jgi:hypothetical protein